MMADQLGHRSMSGLGVEVAEIGFVVVVVVDVGNEE